ncbi:MAG: GNAT family N-acetyltransferase [Oscillospiraceae bacterium]|nr:GNAT family N-acetyltransferase [Oscillospiraceae bacterium]
MLIETERLIVRDFKSDDVNDLYEILGDEETMENCEPAYDFEKTQKFLEDFCIAKKGAVAAVLKDSKKAIGYILFKPLEESVYEIGWIFNKKYWRQGYAYEACSELIAHSFRELNVHKVVAEAIDSHKSVGLMEKLGMKREGVQISQTKDHLGKWADLYLYGILQSDIR